MRYLFCIIVSLFALRGSGQSLELELSSRQVENNKDYQLRLSITYPSPEEKQDKTGYKFGHVYINPVFDTAEQRDTLSLGNSYTATVTPEVIQQEMTKKELKTRNK